MLCVMCDKTCRQCYSATVIGRERREEREERSGAEADVEVEVVKGGPRG
jgi:hypothetical protein